MKLSIRPNQGVSISHQSRNKIGLNDNRLLQVKQKVNDYQRQTKEVLNQIKQDDKKHNLQYADQLSDQQIKEFAQFLSNLGDIQIETDAIRRNIIKDIDLNRLFLHISDNKESISVEDLLLLINSHKINLTSSQISSMMTSQSSWNFDQFSLFINLGTSNLREFRKRNSVSDFNQHATQKNTNDIGFITLLYKESQFYELKDQASKNFQVMIEKILSSITQEEEINIESLVKFVERFKYRFSRQAASGILERINQKNPGQEQISKQQFLQFLGMKPQEQQLPKKNLINQKKLYEHDQQENQTLYNNYLQNEQFPSNCPSYREPQIINSRNQTRTFKSNFSSFQSSPSKHKALLPRVITSSPAVQTQQQNDHTIFREITNKQQFNSSVSRNSTQHNLQAEVKQNHKPQQKKYFQTFERRHSQYAILPFQPVDNEQKENQIDENQDNQNIPLRIVSETKRPQYQDQQYEQYRDEDVHKESYIKITENQVESDYYDQNGTFSITEKVIKLQEMSVYTSDSKYNIQDQNNVESLNTSLEQNIKVQMRDNTQSQNLLDQTYTLSLSRTTSQLNFDLCDTQTNYIDYFEDPSINTLLNEFSDYLLTIIECNKELDAYRINLLNQEDFDIIQIFSLFDLNQNGMIPLINLKDLLRLILRLDTTEEDVRLLANQYCKNKKGSNSMNFSQFSDIFIPRQPHQHIKNLIMRKLQNNNIDQSFRIINVQNDIKDTFEKIFRVERVIHQRLVRFNQIMRERKFEVENIFSRIAQSEKLVKAKLQEMLIDFNQYYASDRELNVLIERFDHKMLGFIDIEDFLNEIKIR